MWLSYFRLLQIRSVLIGSLNLVRPDCFSNLSHFYFIFTPTPFYIFLNIPSLIPKQC